MSAAMRSVGVRMPVGSCHFIHAAMRSVGVATVGMPFREAACYDIPTTRHNPVIKLGRFDQPSQKLTKQLDHVAHMARLVLASR